jgi:hypothetical protein
VAGTPDTSFCQRLHEDSIAKIVFSVLQNGNNLKGLMVLTIKFLFFLQQEILNIKMEIAKLQIKM